MCGIVKRILKSNRFKISTCTIEVTLSVFFLCSSFFLLSVATNETSTGKPALRQFHKRACLHNYNSTIITSPMLSLSLSLLNILFCPFLCFLLPITFLFFPLSLSHCILSFLTSFAFCSGGLSVGYKAKWLFK